MSVGIFVVSCGAAGVCWLLTMLVHRSRENLRMFRELESGFFKAANILADDERTPDIVLSFIEAMACNIRDRRCAGRLLFSLITNRADQLAKHPPQYLKDLKGAVAALPAELHKCFTLASVSFALGITYRSFIAGTMLRRLAFYPLRSAPIRDVAKNDAALVTTSPALAAVARKLKPEPLPQAA